MTNLYETVREFAGWLDLSDWGLVQATGPDRVRFLQGQTTNDLRLLQPGRGIYTAFCTPTGHLLSDAYLLDEGESLLLLPQGDAERQGDKETRRQGDEAQSPEALKPEALKPLTTSLPHLLTRLQSLIILDEVELLSLQEVIGVVSLQGPQAGVVLEEIGIENAPQEELNHRSVTWSGTAIRVVRCDRTGSGGYDLFVPSEKMEEFKTALITAGAPEIEEPTWHVLRYEAGIPLYGIDMDAKVIASEMGATFERKFISYTKGCYTGQEVLMRIHARGHTNRTWVPLHVEGDILPAHDDPVEAEDRPDAGRITGAVFSPTLNGILAWGFVRNAYIAPGTRLRVRQGEARLPTTVLEKPPWMVGS